MDYDLMLIILCTLLFAFFFVILAQMKENSKLSLKVQSLSNNQGDIFKEIDQLALKVQAINTDLYKALLRPPVVSKAQPKRRGRPPGSANKTKGATK